ncbi:MAG: energy transducer TonB [Candidatus Aquilonibacter sp.]
MDNKRARRFLIVAFALSLLIHLILTGIIRWPFRPSSDDVQVVSIEHLHTIHIAHVTPPPHTPAPRFVPVHVAKATAVNPRSSLTEGAIVSGTPVAQASPLPTPTPTPNCATNDTPVQMLASPPPLDIPPNARAGRVSGITRVRVLVDQDGKVQDVTVLSSSGSSALDQVVVSSLRASQYSPALHACKAIASDFTYSVRFIAW